MKCGVHFNPVNMTLVTHFCEPKLFSSLFYTTMTHDNATLESPFCHIKEVVNVKILVIYVIHLKYIHLHLETA